MAKARKIIPISRSEDLTTIFRADNEEARFCIEKCPHKTCKGICEEFVAFKKKKGRTRKGD